MRVIVSVRDQALAATLQAFPGRFAEGMLTAMRRVGLLVQRRAKALLSDDVLMVRTGTLRRSINLEVSAGGTTIDATVGTNVVYAAAHEYGFDGDVTVRAHLRRISTNRRAAALAGPNGKPLKMPKLGGYARRRLYVSGSAEVAEHTRHMHLPERSFLRRALEEMQAQATEEINRAASRALRP